MQHKRYISVHLDLFSLHNKHLNVRYVHSAAGGLSIKTWSPTSFGISSIFELLGFMLNGKLPVLCVLIIYGPQNRS